MAEEIRSLIEWTKFRMNAVKTCQILMGRQLQEWEKEVFLFPRVCRVCRTSRNKPNMIDCFSCLGVTYCSQEHQEQDKKHHTKFCQELKYAMVSCHSKRVHIAFILFKALKHCH